MITITGLTKKFGSKVAVDSLDFVVENGTVTGFVGPNGAGKSTTMRCIVGLDRPTAGSALVDGVAYADLPDPVNRVGALLDPTWVNPGASARAHLRWLSRAAGLPVGRGDEMLERVGLADVGRKRVGGFSLGMRQRLGLAGALLGDPDHLILDEPLNGLDPEGVRWVRRLIREYADEGRAVLVSSHLLGELSLVADSIVLLGQGRLLGHQPTSELIDSVSTGRVVVRVDGPAERVLRLAAEHGWSAEVEDDGIGVSGDGLTGDDVGRACARAGIGVLELRAERGTLEDAVFGRTAAHTEYSTEGAAR